MNRVPGPAYRFVTPAQRAQLFDAGLAEALTLDPATAEDRGTIGGCAAEAMAPGPRGGLFWVDARGRLFATGPDGTPPGALGPRVGRTARLAAGAKRLWVLLTAGEACGRRLVQLDAATLHVLSDREAARVDDIAPDGKDGAWLLSGRRIGHVDARGREAGPTFDLAAPAAQLAAAGNRIAALAEDGRSLAILAAGSGDGVIVPLAELLGTAGPLAAPALCGTGDGFLLSGRLDVPTVKHCFVLIDLDGNAVLRGDWRDDRAPRLLGAAGGDLHAVFGDGRLLRFAGFTRRGGRRWLTPALETERPEGTWLRAEARVRLPEGATLGFRWAASDDPSLRRLVETTLADRTLTETARLEAVEALLPWSGTYTYVGVADPAARNEAQAGLKAERFVLPLHEGPREDGRGRGQPARRPILWVDVQLRGNGAAAEPALESLVVMHEAASLMDDLPAIYSGDGDRDGTMRRLVGVLEATTQELDGRIAGLAARLDPTQPEDKWLASLAAMLGLPFHDALSEAMRRGLVAAAPAILARRGTRAGLLAMLLALFPGRPVRVVDRTGQMLPLALGAGRIPALLAGPSARVPRLNARLILKRTALCPATACSDFLLAPAPEVLVAIPATRRERRLYATAVRAMIEEMLPAGVRLRLRWTAWRAAAGTAPKGVLTRLDPPDFVGLGDGPGLGGGRLGGPSVPRLDGHGVTPAEHRLI